MPKYKTPKYKKKDIDSRGVPKTGGSYDKPPFGPIRVHRLNTFGMQPEIQPENCEADNGCTGHAEYLVMFFHLQDYCCGFRPVKERKLCAIHTRCEF